MQTFLFITGIIFIIVGVALRGSSNKKYFFGFGFLMFLTAMSYNGEVGMLLFIIGFGMLLFGVTQLLISLKRKDHRKRAQLLVFTGIALCVVGMTISISADNEDANQADAADDNEQDNEASEQDNEASEEDNEASDFNEIKEHINKENYAEAKEAVKSFNDNYPESEHTSDLNDLEPLIDEGIKHKEMMDSSILEDLTEVDINKEHAIEVYKVIHEIDLPIWDNIETISVENQSENDYIMSFSAKDGDVIRTVFAIHLLDGEVVEVVDEKLNVVYDTNGLNPDYLFYRDVDLSNLMRYAEKTVESALKAPSTAEFPGGFLSPYEGWSFSKSGNLIEITSFVDSQNSFGAMVRNNFVLVMEKTPDTYNGVYFELDGNVLVNKL